MRFALAGGGTGGHVYPALAVAERLREGFDTELVYYGTARGPEHAIVTEAGIEYRTITASQLRGRSPVRVLRGLYSLWRGSRQAGRQLREDAPAALFATGGYVAAPAGRAAALNGIPLVVFLPDVRPGWAVRFLQRYATTVACAVEDSLQYLPKRKTVVTGYPVRRQFTEATREQGIARFGLDPTLRTILVSGGSLGAHQLNRVISDSLRSLLDRSQLIHICGRDEEHWLARERERLPDWQRERYHLHAYTDEMAWAMAAADLAVTRAGASTLGELPVSGLAAIVIPGAFSDQHANARYLVAQGAAVALDPGDVGELPELISDLLEDEPRRAGMSEAMRRIARPGAAARIATLLREVAT